MPFRVMTWNVLAHVHTHWNHRDHGGSEKALETEAQRRTRHRAVVNVVMRELPDVVLLQEVDEFFMPPDWQAGLLPCGVSLPGYEAFKSYALVDSGHLEGVVILFRKGIWEPDPQRPPILLERSEKRGWKCGLVVPACRCLDRLKCCFVSVHLTPYKLPGKIGLLSDALEAIGSDSEQVILGGDFNTEMGPDLAPLNELLGSHGLSDVPLAPETPTGIDGTAIDYVYCKGLAALGVGECTAGPLPKRPKHPWSADAPNDGSDHAWLLVTLGTSSCCLPPS